MEWNKYINNKKPWWAILNIMAMGIILTCKLINYNMLMQCPLYIWEVVKKHQSFSRGVKWMSKWALINPIPKHMSGTRNNMRYVWNESNWNIVFVHSFKNIRVRDNLLCSLLGLNDLNAFDMWSVAETYVPIKTKKI